MGIIEKNTVNAEGQLKKDKYVSIHYPENKGLKVMFVGNSITLHGILPSIGWHFEHGMAASAPENDYVHIAEREILKKYPDASFCICQAAFWEKNYKNGTEHLGLYANAREFEPDVIIMRLVENCPRDEYDSDLFKKQYDALIKYLDKGTKAKFVITNSFWPTILDGGIEEYAKENHYPFVSLSDLSDDKSTMALGLFEHEGVALHPGDKGMKAIADRIITCMKENGII